MKTAAELEDLVAKTIARGQLTWSIKETGQQIPGAFVIDKIIADTWANPAPQARLVRDCARDIARSVLAIPQIKAAFGSGAKRPEPLPVIDVEAL